VIPTSPDDVRRLLRARLAEGHLFRTVGVSTVRHGTGRSCIVCGRDIDPPSMEHEVEGPGVVGLAHGGECYQMWHEESVRLHG
jgi:hypothetical protein